MTNRVFPPNRRRLRDKTTSSSSAEATTIATRDDAPVQEQVIARDEICVDGKNSVQAQQRHKVFEKRSIIESGVHGDRHEPIQYEIICSTVRKYQKKLRHPHRCPVNNRPNSSIHLRRIIPHLDRKNLG